MNANTAIPAGHPPIGDPGAMQPQVQAAIDKANAEPDNFEAQIKAAEMYYQIQRFDAAIEFLKRANQIKPEDYDTLVNLGNAYFDAARYEDAEKSYTAALLKKSDDINLRNDLGLTYIFRQPPDYDRAIREFLLSLEKDPNHPQALQNLTVAYTKKGDAEKAKATLARLEALDPANTAIAPLREDIQKLESK
jgi:tetratricopeptide (TPR) repeat protein